MLKTQTIPLAQITSSRIIYGCMKIGGAWNDAPPNGETIQKARAVVNRALEAGITFYDHADIYGNGKAEEVFGCLLAEQKSLREKITLQSKCGIRREDFPPGAPARYDFSKEHILTSVEGSLKRLGTPYLDILLLHRPDALVEPDEVAAAFSQLKRQGKVKHFGVSNHGIFQIELLKKSLDVPLVVNQLQVSLTHHGLISDGLVVNQTEKPYPAGTGLLDYLRLNQITIQAWSPIARGILSRDLPPESSHLKPMAEAVQKMSREKGVTVEALLTAWLLRHPAQIQPILGTTSPDRLSALLAADQLALSREEWYQLTEAARGKVA